MKKLPMKIRAAALLSASAILLLGSTAGSARAALTYYSENYAAQVTVSNIGVSLSENGETVSRRDYASDGKWNEKSGELLKALQGIDVKPGKSYEERLSVTNSGSIDTYVRVILKKSWKDAEGNKDTNLSPALIELGFVPDSGWIIDEEASTPERTVLYYTKILPAGGTTPAFTDTVRIDPQISTKVETETTVDENGYKTITYKYAYDGYTFSVEAEADAVQTHNAADAIRSAWGRNITVEDDGTIRLQ